ncbi:hypothetical protein K493DRAFT_72175 [Basidiobolus meristosporus CBS 931.73]|uniref:Uncharacterized protein n=1 Tax=Basidiobolus meristosporus CBS 931.73 TaxID=1314790 RepID=A0A1Y1YZ14_9FUNG|nr:hypothetical protein K493DRAFT_72175 [Basidiobolus meristosporus CBS 931.73]|eukprot:ORY03272.1 hypothetical protein K493DRAFT_72175 [Basidiobolus meristosporus CBS 931.73]
MPDLVLYNLFEPYLGENTKLGTVEIPPLIPGVQDNQIRQMSKKYMTLKGWLGPRIWPTSSFIKNDGIFACSGTLVPGYHT